MKLTPKQLKTQEAILMKIYPGNSLKTIRRKEYLVKGCIIKGNGYGVKIYEFGGIDLENKQYIIGLPPSLARVLSALGHYHHMRNLGTYGDEGYVKIYSSLSNGRDYWSVQRKLLNDNKTEATLWDQTEDTQDKIAEILGVDL